jgi:hypothetical protein
MAMSRSVMNHRTADLHAITNRCGPDLLAGIDPNMMAALAHTTEEIEGEPRAVARGMNHVMGSDGRGAGAPWKTL